MPGNQGKYLLLVLLVDVTACAFSRGLGSGQSVLCLANVSKLTKLPLLLTVSVQFQLLCCVIGKDSVYLLQGLNGCPADILVPSVCFSSKL